MREACYNAILLGGTGAKCGEILLHMCANGYFKYKSLNILYIDSDRENGNAKKFTNLYSTYVKCREKYLIEGSPMSCLFYPKVNLMIEDPVRNFKFFSDMVNAQGSDYESSEGARTLMEALYSEEEIELRISDGFFAHPNVGAAVFAANMEEIMSNFTSLIKVEMQQEKVIKIFILGSVFGGTGAASLPTIARYIKEKLIGASDNRNIEKLMKIGACMVLPYFLFKVEDNISDNGRQELAIEADKFAMKTRAALEYYKYVDEESERKIFDELFILGHERADVDVRGRYAAAGESQRNLPHIVEFYAAMSAVTFFEDEMGKKGNYFAVVPADRIGGESIYGAEMGYGFFFTMMRFAFVMESLVIEELFDYTQKNKLRKKAKKIPWYYDFLNGKDVVKDFEPSRLYDYFKEIQQYCDEYIRWFAELNLGNIDKLKILNQVDYGEKSEDVISHVDFFSKELLFRQYQNIQIKNGDVELEDETARNLYEMNLKYIRKNLENLEKIHFNTDKASEKIGMDRIWSRLSEMGFNHFIKDDEIFRNIAQSEDKSMRSGVRNLINAVFCACLF